MSPTWEKAQDIVRDTVKQGISDTFGERHAKHMLRHSGISMSRKDLKALREKMKVSSRLSVSGRAVILVDGAQVERTVRLWDSLPPWWNRATVDQRAAWLRAFFARQLQVDPAAMVSVISSGR